ncbi:expressed protein [Phakopsora pachyrhizi]|uniref:Expressed protein n=1 Tax=Phakopsora pachyrhizi TaxID=170000 RepID=A0AAV0B4P7_PHAPC|nr:expressed protein [Phakopsora pachyrhizi]
MFWLRLCLILWLSPSVIFRVRVAQGFFHSSPLGEAGEHQSLDSALWNSRDIHNTQQNVQTDEQNHNVHSAHPVDSDFSTQMPVEHTNRAEDEILPLDEWLNRKDSAPNLEEAMNSYHGDLWTSAPVDYTSFSGQNHQKQTYSHVGPSHDQGSSFNTVQPNYDEDFFGGYHSNLAPHFDEFPYPDSSFEPQPHQNFEISHDEQMSQYPAFHSMQNYLSNSPNLSENRDRFYQNQDRQLSNFNPASSSENYGFLNIGTAIDHRKNFVFKHSKNSMGKEAYSPAEEKYLFIDTDKSELVSTLNNDFSRFSRKEALSRIPYKSTKNDERYLRSTHEKAVDVINEHNPHNTEEVKVDPRTKTVAVKINAQRRRKTQEKYMIFDYTLKIEWEGSYVLKADICRFADNFEIDTKDTKLGAATTQNHIKIISYLGVNFMKIIAKMYSNDPVSKAFGNDRSLLQYTERFWECCFKNDAGANKLKIFFKSLGIQCSNKELKQFLSTTFLKAKSSPKSIFLRIKTRVTHRTEKKMNYIFSWYFVYFRAMAYYPHLVFAKNHQSGSELKTSIEDKIMHAIDTGEKIL